MPDSNPTLLTAICLGLLVLYMAVRLISGRKLNTTVLAARIKAGAMVVDVRTPAEYSDKHFRDALNIPIDELATRLPELGTDKSRCIIVYCASGSRASKASKLLRQAGFTDIINAGGLFNLPRD